MLVGSYVWFKPSVGIADPAALLRRPAHVAAVLATGLAVGFYDGAIGPGTGSFFVFALVGLLGYDFLQASAKAKLANWATNLAALVVFIPQGAVLWQLAPLMAAANIVGRVRRSAGRDGSRGALRAGLLPGRRDRTRRASRRWRARRLVSIEWSAR